MMAEYIQKFGVGLDVARKFEFKMYIDTDDASESWLDQHFQQGHCYEPEIVHLMLRALRPGDFVIDVGANVGFFTLLLSKLVGDAGAVLAIEPGRNVLPRLRQNLKLNDVANVDVCPDAAWKKHGEEVVFYLNADSSGGNALWDPALWPFNVKTRAEGTTNYKVKTTTLDKLAGSTPRLIKIDCEGAEMGVLVGATDLLTRNRRPDFVIVEFNPFGSNELGFSAHAMWNMMAMWDYELFLLHPDGSLPSLVPRECLIQHHSDSIVFSALFSTLSAVAEAWPRVPHDR